MKKLEEREIKMWKRQHGARLCSAYNADWFIETRVCDSMSAGKNGGNLWLTEFPDFYILLKKKKNSLPATFQFPEILQWLTHRSAFKSQMS